MAKLFVFLSCFYVLKIQQCAVNKIGSGLRLTDRYQRLVSAMK